MTQQGTHTLFSKNPFSKLLQKNLTLSSVCSSTDMPPAVVIKDMYHQSILLNQGHHIFYILHNQISMTRKSTQLSPLTTSEPHLFLLGSVLCHSNIHLSVTEESLEEDRTTLHKSGADSQMCSQH